MVDLDACLRGEKDAWDAFVDHAAPILFAAVHRTLARHGVQADAAEVEDLAQDVFLRLVKDRCRLLRRYEPARASLATWLTVIARSVTIDHLRRRKPQPMPLDAAPPPAAPPAEPSELDLPPDLLSPRQALVLRLLFEDGHTVEEAAAALDVVPQTIRSTKHKAIARLRQFFGRHRDGSPGGDAPPPKDVEQDGKEP